MVKNIFLIVVLVLTSLSCSKDDKETKNNLPTELIGKWKLTEEYTNSGGGEFNWVEVDTQLEYDIWFKENAKVIMAAHNENCKTGTYDVVENVISYNFPCFGESNVPIDSLSINILITNVSYIEYELNKYQKVIE